jgi:hypothetical protein
VIGLIDAAKFGGTYGGGSAIIKSVIVKIQSSASTIAASLGGRSLKLTTDLDGVVAFDLSVMLLPVVAGIWACNDRITLDATDNGIGVGTGTKLSPE